MQIFLAHVFHFRPILKTKGSLHKKQANELSDKHGILQTFSLVSVGMLLNQREGHRIWYCYRVSEIHC